MKEEDFILEKAGNRRPFRTPEGYFENLHADIMASLPSAPAEKAVKISFWEKNRIWAYMAASFVGMLFVFNFAVKFMQDDTVSSNSIAESPELYTDEYIDSFFETAMIDEYTLYCSLTNTGSFSQL